MKVEIGVFERLLVWYARRFPVDKGKLRVVNALWRSVCRSDDGSCLRLSRLNCGYEVMCDVSEMIQRQLYFFGDYFVERRLLKYWTELAEDSSVIFDVGANVGIYSLTALSANAGSRVHAFEPTPEIAAHLEESARTNELNTLKVHRIALADRPGALSLVRYAGETGDNGGMNFVKSFPESSDSEIQVQADTVDRLCEVQGINEIDLMKIDVQGNEPQVLRGAAGLLGRKAIRWILLELNWDEPGDSSAQDCLNLLDSYGYRFVVPGEAGRRQLGSWLQDYDDIFATVEVA